ncbi:MAG: GreA/GreB family elongation factor, partial [Clostridium perfringens]|nr:GreA/GreB family elongation factor [Clostridium perfringens]
RIQYLLTMISTAIIVDEESNDKSTLGLNSKARIKFVEDDDEDVVTLVTTMDLDLENMCISIESDLGKALMGKKVGDVVEVEAPGGNYTVEVLEIL